MSTTTTAVEVRAPEAIATQLRAVKPYLDRLLPDPARLGVTLMVAARRNPQILQCDPASVVGAALVCAQLNLEPGPAEHIYLIPRRNRKTNTLDLELLVGYKGFKALAERHPAIRTVRTGTVYSDEEFAYAAQPPALKHTPKVGVSRKDEEPLCWYAVAERTDGGAPHIRVLSKEDVEARRRKSSSPDSPAWKDHYDAMARKSCIRAMWSELPSSLDMERAAALGEAGAVVKPQDLGVPALPEGEPNARLVDADGVIIAEGRIDDLPPVQDDDGPIDVGGSPQASGTEVHSEPPAAPATPAESSPPSASPSSGAPASERIATDKQKQLLAIAAQQMGWDDETRHARAGVASFNDLTFDRAHELCDEWIRIVNDWRKNRRDRLRSECDIRKLSLESVLQLAGYTVEQDLTVPQLQALIDEVAALEVPTEDEPPTPPASPDQDVRARLDSLLLRVSSKVQRARWLHQQLQQRGAEQIEDLDAKQVTDICDELERHLEFAEGFNS